MAGNEVAKSKRRKDCESWSEVRAESR